MTPTYAETLVARVTGVKKKVVAEARHESGLMRGPDWILSNSCVHYTPAGLEKICGALGIDSSALEWRDDAARSDDRGEETQASRATGAGLDATPEKIAVAVETVAAAVAQITRETPVPVEIRIARLSRNPRVLIGQLGEAFVTVMVRDSKNFLPGMVVRADRIDELRYTMVGNCPRWRGRW